MDYRKSILRQLAKYQPPPEPKKVDIEALGLPKPESAQIGSCDVLYPKKLWDAYKAMREDHVAVPEQVCDVLLANFMASADKAQYLVKFKQAVTPKVMRLIMLRVLVASYGMDNIAGGNLPSSYRSLACDILGIMGTLDYKYAVDMIEHESRYAPHDDLILGRIGYLMIWQNRGAEVPALPW